MVDGKLYNPEGQKVHRQMQEVTFNNLCTALCCIVTSWCAP